MKPRAPRWCKRCNALKPWQKVRLLGARASFRACLDCGGRTLKATPGKRRHSNPTKRPIKKLADGLWALIVRHKCHGRCIACGTTALIQAAHIVSRRYHSTRYRLDNGVPLCAGCHRAYTSDPLGWKQFIDWRLPGALEILEPAALVVVKLDYVAVVVALQAEVRTRGLTDEAVRRRLL